MNMGEKHISKYTILNTDGARCCIGCVLFSGYNNGAAVSPPGSPVALRKGSPGLGLRHAVIS